MFVLVVDDFPDAAESAAELVSMTGCRARAVMCGGDALRAVAEEAPNVVLLDLGMPGMNGWETAQRIRDLVRVPQPVIVAVSGHAREADRHRSADAGIDLHLAKPADPAVILALLDRVRVHLAPRLS
ncbi:pas sensor protein : PAS sensor protein OS=Nitrosococcus halophilus (strain Nc4) GN=Nhal_1977 PE=4 SV=1: Response_reg [Gemmataceae bacterium]|nr:pas sensor protein : PAS sensor protein OS=Nitrosococcus halophilus (strain Nc4) GN=Nhal_1977 PE=4 SV=1: Response_reg [Gemmataceae bacterium]VTT99029.1 pas sensor protein : PAS sensor protein OS=Nitrosococcus halophilus (strain Nc4) GN=Nhal_1977 PE=4 SV=1: Response_reg [Gemmataceae bacterium]